ncbi:Speckle-type POZ protein [Orchesella cincta]|uniref:Speckle-type POZ protein n=1 Tax=Orchesella cincta TaxID=48709 RepID=A0A1D2MC30_ORCCI|nr:Speckle-type POZ protein [Orchesella cincta]
MCGGKNKDMDSIKRQLYLLKDQQPKQHFHWARPGHTVLYEGTFQDLKLSSIGQSMDENDTTIISSIEHARTQPMDRSYIEMVVKYDKPNDKFKPAATAILGDSFVRCLSNLLSEPTIYIQGKFANDTNRPFKTTGMQLKAINYVEDIEGAANIMRLLNERSDYTHIGITYSIILEWKDLKVTVKKDRSAVLDKLFSEKLLTDCCIVAAEGKEVACHRNVLAANSDVILAMLTSGMEESRNNKIPMIDISEEVVNLLLAYLYGRDINTAEMEEDIAYDLLRTAHKYNISSLQELMAVTLFNKSNDSFTTNTVLDVYFFTLNLEELTELCNKMLNILKSNPRKLIESTVYKDLIETSPKEAIELALKLLELGIGEPISRSLPEI